MVCKLSKSKIESFAGDVLPLKLTSDIDLSQADIKWSVTGDSVIIRQFSGQENYGFNNGVLITFMKPGNSQVTASFDNKDYICDIVVNQRRTVSDTDNLNFYIGDFHDHTSNDHKHDSFAVRTTDLPIDYINQIKQENLIDFSVISDHADVTNRKDFFRGFTDTELAQPMDIIMFPGSESEVTVIENDRYDLPHKNSGEIVCVNVDNFVPARTWQEFYDAMENAHFAVCVFAHPQVVGWDKNGIWNFSLHKNNTEKLKKMMKAVEMGNGGDRGSNSLHEYIYSVALDCGFKVSATCASDSHGPVWGYNAMPGKTIIMAPEKSREMFLDALLNNRFYACESGNVKLFYTVNGMPAAKTLPITDRYNFHIELGYFKDDITTIPVKCEVISDYGKTVKTLKNADFSSCDFTVESDSARYFFLRFTDSEGRKTWSAPVWTGREYDDTTIPNLTALDKKGFTAKDNDTGKDAGIIINDDPTAVWHSEKPTADIIIDMKDEKQVCAVGHYPPRFHLKQLMSENIEISYVVNRFVSRYRVSTSKDGKTYTEAATGRIRIFGAEEYIIFPMQKARYIRFEALSTTGKESELKKYADYNVDIGELSIFTK